MINSPLNMYYQETHMTKPREVLVYDFMHDTLETLQSWALCWDIKSEAWITVLVAFLSPPEELTMKSTKQKLNEEVILNE